MNHIEELAELYAVGSLEPLEQSKVEAHIAMCEACRGRVGDAERVVLALAEAQPQIEPSRPVLRAPARASRALSTRADTLRFVAGLAAGLILPLLILLPVAFRARQAQERNDVALSALVNSHFNHVSFTPSVAGVPPAKLLYARSGEWLYVIIEQPRSDVTVEVRDARGKHTVGTIGGNRPEGALFVRRPGRVQEVLLNLNGVTLAVAHPILSPARK